MFGRPAEKWRCNAPRPGESLPWPGAMEVLASEIRVLHARANDQRQALGQPPADDVETTLARYAPPKKDAAHARKAQQSPPYPPPPAAPLKLLRHAIAKAPHPPPPPSSPSPHSPPDTERALQDAVRKLGKLRKSTIDDSDECDLAYWMCPRDADYRISGAHRRRGASGTSPAAATDAATANPAPTAASDRGALEWLFVAILFMLLLCFCAWIAGATYDHISAMFDTRKC